MSIAARLTRSGRFTLAVLGLVSMILAGTFLADQWIYRPALDRALAATSATRLSHEAMLNQQTGLRGFIASGDDRFLEAYRVGRDALPELNADASRLISDSRVSGYFVDVRLAQQEWLHGWVPAALEAGRAPTTVPGALLQDDKTLFDAYRQSYDVLISALLDNRADVIGDQRQTNALSILLAFLVTVTAGVLGASSHRRLRRDLAGPLYALIGRLEAIRTGDLAPQAVTDGPAELKLIMEGLEETAATLADAQSEARRHTEALVTRGRRQAEVLTFARTIAGNLNLRYVLRGACTSASTIADGARVVVWLIDEARRNLEPFADSTGPDLQPIGLVSTPVGEELVGKAGQFGKLGRQGEEAPDAEARLAIPMVVGARVIGVLELFGAEVPELTEEAVEVLETMATHAASAIEAARLHEVTSEMAMTDALTGLRNRRRLDADLREECAASARYGRPLAVLMADIDHFKAYNDDFGHQAGDSALQAVAETLADGLRNTDHAYRYGGEEFAVVLRETTSADAATFAERLRGAVEHRFCGTEQLRPVTISIGAASMPDHGSTPNALIAAADDALYQAKKTGRNRMVSAPVPLTLAPEERRQLGGQVDGA